MKRPKLFAPLSLCALLFAFFGSFFLPVQAQDLPSDFSEQSPCSLQIQLPVLSEPASQVRLGLFEAARLENGQFDFLAPFEHENLVWSDFEKEDAAGFLKSLALELAEETKEKSTDPLQKGQCDESGRLVFAGLEPGLYLLTALETGTYGIITPELVVLPHVSDQNTLQNHLDLIPKVQPMPALLVQKTDENNQAITDLFFSFGTFSDEGAEELILELPANEDNGTVRIPLWQGTVYIKEQQAPAGYERSDEILKIEVQDAQTVSVNGAPQKVRDGMVSLDFINHKKKEPAAAESASTAVFLFHPGFLLTSLASFAGFAAAAREFKQ